MRKGLTFWFNSLLILVVLLPLSVQPVKAQIDFPPQEETSVAPDFSSSREFLAENAAPQGVLGPSGLSYRMDSMFGTLKEPYLVDTNHLFLPWGVAVDGNSIWVVETDGLRALKYSSDGTFQAQIGRAGFHDFDDYIIGGLSDLAVAPDGKIWVADYDGAQVLVFNSDLSFNKSIGEQWESGSDNDHFNNPAGIAFDSRGNVYISDGGPCWSNNDDNNQRIQIYDADGNYVNTLGETGVYGGDNSHFHGPRHIAIYNDNLYVADRGNHRVQVFDVSSDPVYVDTITDGLDTPVGVSADANYIYVADEYNHKVFIYRTDTRAKFAELGSGDASQSNGEFNRPVDTTVDASGRLYVVEYDNHRVQQFTYSGGTWTYARTLGVTRVPYLTDNQHIFTPKGVSVAADGGVYVVEQNGYRLLKYNKNGVPLWSIGAPGLSGGGDGDNSRFDGPSDTAVDRSGKVYVVDKYNHRVQIYTSGGIYVATMGVAGSDGSDNLHFRSPDGIAIAPNGNILVADTENQRIQIFNKKRVYVATLGVTGQSGNDNAHFNNPRDVAVDSKGNIYVADCDNNRVQVFNSKRVYLRTLGVAGNSQKQYVYFRNPERLAVDKKNNLYVADGWNNRVEVFNAAGQLISTIAGNWNGNPDQQYPRDGLEGVEGVAVDAKGAVYATSRFSQAVIKKFVPGIPGFTQKNLSGFGDINSDEVNALEVFNGSLYASAGNWETGAVIYSTRDGKSWVPVIQPGFGNGTKASAVPDMVVFGGKLYACTGWSDDNKGQIWRTSDGNAWENVVSDAFGLSGSNNYIVALVEYSGFLYATVEDTKNGVFIFRSSTGDSGSWQAVVTDGLGNSKDYRIDNLVPYKGRLYASVYNVKSGMEIWSSDTGLNWTKDQTGGFGNSGNVTSGAMAVYNQILYVGTGNLSGGQLWKFDGSTWSKAAPDGLGDSTNTWIGSVFPLDGYLYLTTESNDYTGMEIWRSEDGINFSPLNQDGLGTSTNIYVYQNHALAIFKNSLYLGTGNYTQGGQVWAMDPIRIRKPAIQTMTPGTVAAGSGDFTLTITGKNFMNGSVIYFGKTALVTTQVNRTTLQAVVPASLLAKAKKVSVTVGNPKPGGKSRARAFKITKP